MSLGIYYAPKEKGKRLPVSTPSSFIEMLSNAFDSNLPIEIGVEDMPIIRGIKAADKHNASIYEEIENAVQQFGTIKIWAES